MVLHEREGRRAHMSLKLKVCFIFLTDSVTFTSLQKNSIFHDFLTVKINDVMLGEPNMKDTNTQKSDPKPPQTKECCQKRYIIKDSWLVLTLFNWEGF